MDTTFSQTWRKDKDSTLTTLGSENAKGTLSLFGFHVTHTVGWLCNTVTVVTVKVLVR